MTKPTRAALFDIDGTLLHGQGSGRRAFLHALETMAGRALDDHGFSFAGRTDLEILRELRRLNDLPDATEDETGRFVTLYCRQLDEELRAIGGASTYPGVPELITAMEDGSWMIGLLTGNLREGARRKLESVGLWERFRFGAFGDDHIDRNRLVPVALARIEEQYRLSLRPERVLVLGDTERDVACARAGGAKVLGVRNGWDDGEALKRAEPDLYFESLTETDAVLGAIERLIPA